MLLSGARRLSVTGDPTTAGIGHRRNGVRPSFAWQQSSGPNVRFGSKADIRRRSGYVRFTPESGHRQTRWACPLWAISAHSARPKWGRGGYDRQRGSARRQTQKISAGKFHFEPSLAARLSVRVPWQPHGEHRALALLTHHRHVATHH